MPDCATWTDLPTEIIDQILLLCDTPALLALSYLNTQLNTLALNLLFKRENVTNPRQGYVVSRLAAPEIIPALNATLWLNHLPHVTYYLNPDVKRLYSEVRGLERLVGRVKMNDRLDLYFSSVDRWFADFVPRRVGELVKIEPVLWRTIFVRLLETALKKGCKSMRVEGAHRLEMYYVDEPSLKIVEETSTTSTSVPGSTASVPSTDSIPLPQLVQLVGLMPPVTTLPGQVDEYVSSLAVASLGQEAGHVSSISVSPVPSKLSVKKRLTRWVKKRLGLQAPKPPLHVPSPRTPSVMEVPPPMPTIQVTPAQESVSTAVQETFIIPDTDFSLRSFQTSTPCLKTFNLRSSMMLQPLFFPHTLNLIRAHSSTLKTLELVSIKVPQSVWTTLFESIHLPVLEHFVYLYDTLIVEEPLVTPTLLLDFFKRHPSLKTVELYGAAVGDQGEETAKVEFPAVEPTLLPNLTQLDAHPKIVSWLLQWPQACPKLAHVSLTSEYAASRFLTPSLNPYKAFDTGLLTLSSLLASTTSFPPDSTTYITPPTTTTTGNDHRPIHLQLKFSTEHCLLDWFLSHTSPIPPTRPSVLELLTNVRKLTISAHYHTRFEIGHKQVLPRIFGLMRNLRELELTELPYPEELRDDVEFIENVKVNVKKLERFMIGRNVVWDAEGYEGSVVEDGSWEL